MCQQRKRIKLLCGCMFLLLLFFVATALSAACGTAEEDEHERRHDATSSVQQEPIKENSGKENTKFEIKTDWVRLTWCLKWGFFCLLTSRAHFCFCRCSRREPLRTSQYLRRRIQHHRARRQTVVDFRGSGGEKELYKALPRAEHFLPDASHSPHNIPRHSETEPIKLNLNPTPIVISTNIDGARTPPSSNSGVATQPGTSSTGDHDQHHEDEEGDHDEHHELEWPAPTPKQLEDLTSRFQSLYTTKVCMYSSPDSLCHSLAVSVCLVCLCSLQLSPEANVSAGPVLCL